MSMLGDAIAIDTNEQVEDNEILVVESEDDLKQSYDIDVISISYSDIKIIQEDAKQMLDDGKMIYIAEPEVSNEDIAKFLSIPKNDIKKYNSLVLVATYIYKLDEMYVFGNSWAAIPEVLTNTNTRQISNDELLDPQESKQSFEKNVILLPDASKKYPTAKLIDANDGVTEAIIEQEETTSFYEEVDIETLVSNENNEANLLTTTLPNIEQGVLINNDEVAIYSPYNTKLGNCYVTQYIYQHGKHNVNGKMQSVYDAVGVFKASPSNSTTVRTFTGRMHSNIQGHTMIESVIMPSDNKETATLSMGTNVTFSYSFNPDGHTIRSSNPQANIADYIITTNSPKLGAAVDMSPCVRVATTNGVGSRGVFSKLTCPSMLFGIAIKSFDVEVGAWF